MDLLQTHYDLEKVPGLFSTHAGKINPAPFARSGCERNFVSRHGLFDAVTPVSRSTTLMRDSDDDDPPMLNRINQSIGKAINKEFAIFNCVRNDRDGTDVMIFPEPLDRLFELTEKRPTQPSSFEFEVVSCARQLCIRRRK
jgi:hypothetical protein